MESQSMFYPRPDSESDANNSDDSIHNKSDNEDPLPPLLDFNTLKDLPPQSTSPLDISPPPPPSPPPSSTLQTPPTLEREPSISDDLMCSICASLLHDPVSLHCGHSFCQLCLAAMWKSNGEPQSAADLKCPVCRSLWRNFPGVNIQLRKIILKNYPSQCLEREEGMAMEDQLLLHRFKVAKEKESKWKDKTIPNMRREEIRRLVIILLCCFAFCVAFLMIGFVVMLLVMVGAEGDFMRKPVIQWTQTDVAEWVSGLGEWAATNYTNIFLSEHINGPRLLELDDVALKTIGIRDDYRRHSILRGIETLREEQYNTPRNFHEFKAANRRETLMVALFYVMWPRLTLIYTYFTNYYDVFLPLLCNIFPGHEANSDPSYGQLVVMFLEILLLPHFLVGQFAWQWVGDYPWVAYPVLFHCCWRMWLEGKSLVRRVHSRNWAGLRMMRREVLFQLAIVIFRLTIRHIFTFFVFFLMVWLAWHVTPYFLCDLLFQYIIWHTVIYILFWKPFQRLRRWCGLGHFRAHIQMNFNGPNG